MYRKTDNMANRDFLRHADGAASVGVGGDAYVFRKGQDRSELLASVGVKYSDIMSTQKSTFSGLLTKFQYSKFGNSHMDGGQAHPLVKLTASIVGGNILGVTNAASVMLTGKDMFNSPTTTMNDAGTSLEVAGMAASITPGMSTGKAIIQGSSEVIVPAYQTIDAIKLSIEQK